MLRKHCPNGWTVFFNVVNYGKYRNKHRKTDTEI